MEKIIARITNIITVLNLTLIKMQPGSEEIITFMGTNYYKQHITTLQTLIWAAEAVDINKKIVVIYNLNSILVEGL